MNLRCHITLDDYTRAQFINLRPRPIIKWVGSLIGAAALVFSIQQLIFPPFGVFTWAPLSTLGGLACIAVYFGVILPQSTKKIYSQQKTLQEPYDLELTEEACETISVYGTVKIRWTEFHKYKMSGDMILVYQSDAIFHIFPKRWFTEEQFVDFEAILQRHLGQPK